MYYVPTIMYYENNYFLYVSFSSETITYRRKTDYSLLGWGYENICSVAFEQASLSICPSTI